MNRKRPNVTKRKSESEFRTICIWELPIRISATLLAFLTYIFVVCLSLSMLMSRFKVSRDRFLPQSAPFLVHLPFDGNVMDLLKAFLGNGSLNTFQRATMEDVAQSTNVIALG
jgi:hypothetical protein